MPRYAIFKERRDRLEKSLGVAKLMSAMGSVANGYLLRGARVWDGTSEACLEAPDGRMVVGVDDGKISFVGPELELPPAMQGFELHGHDRRACLQLSLAGLAAVVAAAL